MAFRRFFLRRRPYVHRRRGWGRRRFRRHPWRRHWYGIKRKLSRWQRSFRGIFRRRIFNPHPRSYTVKRTCPYNILTLLFQGVIKVPLGVTEKKLPNTSTYKYVARLDFSLWTFFLAYYTTNNRLGGPHHETGIQNYQFPTEWYRWAYAIMQPTWGIRFTGEMPQFNADQIFNWFSRFQLFRHVKSTFAVLNTAPGPSIQSGYSPMISVLASLLTQDKYFHGSFPNDDQHNNLKYQTFLQLSARGAPWCMPPGQRGSKGGLFNHHSMTGTNDPMADPWLPLLPAVGQVDYTNTGLQSQLQRVFGSLHLALFLSLSPTGAAGTGVGQAYDKGLENTWALIRFKSIWQLANDRPIERMYIQFMGSERGSAGSSAPMES